MSVADIILLVILGYFAVRGVRTGFVRLVGGFIGILLGSWIAGVYYDEAADFLLQFVDISVIAAIVSAFIILYLIVNLLVGVVADIVMKVFKVIPLATVTNRLVGGALGLLEGFLLIGIILWAVLLFPIENKFVGAIKNSRVAGYFVYSTQLVRPLLPESLRSVDFTLLQDLSTFTDEKAEFFEKNMPKFFDRIKKDREERQQKVDETIKVFSEDGQPSQLQAN